MGRRRSLIPLEAISAPRATAVTLGAPSPGSPVTLGSPSTGTPWERAAQRNRRSVLTKVLSMGSVALKAVRLGKVSGAMKSSKMREAARKVKSILLVQAAYRGYRVRKHVKRSGIMYNLLVSPTAVRHSLKDVATKHTGLGRLILHVLLGAFFLSMVALQSGTSDDRPDPYHIHTSLLRRLQGVAGTDGRTPESVEAPLDVWDVLHGVVDEFYTMPLVSRDRAAATATPRFDNATRRYLGCARPANDSVLLARADGVDPATRTAGRGYIDGSNRLLHSLIVVQQRRVMAPCAAQSPAKSAGSRGTRPFENEPNQVCMVDGSHDETPFSVRGSTVRFPHMRVPSALDEEALDWTGFPLAFDLGLVGVSAKAVQCKMRWLRDAGWVDTRRTKEMKVVVAAYNPNAGSLYALAIMQWKFPVAGGRVFTMRSYTLSGRTLSPFRAASMAAGLRTWSLWLSFVAFVALLALSTVDFVKRACKRKTASSWKYKAQKEPRRQAATGLIGRNSLWAVVHAAQSAAQSSAPPMDADADAAAAAGSSVPPAKKQLAKAMRCCGTTCEFLRIQGCSYRSRAVAKILLVLDFSVLALLHMVWILWIVLAAKRRDLDEAFAGSRRMMVEPAASVYAALSRGASQDEALLADAYAAHDIVASDRVLIDVLLSFILYKRVVIVLSMLMVARFFRLLQFHQRIALIGELVTIAASELLHYFVVYIPVHIALVWTSVLLYGSQSDSFHTFGNALHFLSIVFIGDPIIPEDVLENHSISPYLFFWTYFALTSLVMSNVLISIVVSAYMRLQKRMKEMYVVSLFHIAGRSAILMPKQFAARYLCFSRWVGHVCGPRPSGQKRTCCGPEACANVQGPVRQLRNLATRQKGELRTKSVRVQLQRLGFTSYQSDRIVTQMQHFDRVQHKRKLEQIAALLIGGGGTSAH